ncbi:MAG: AAA family ATPase [Acetobacteraceae bacterium]|nr:AAA family ATPase [Acetobacteraceae bacterium]
MSPPPPRGRTIGRLLLLGVADAIAAPPRAYLVKGLLAAGELGVLFGEPGCGKSFLAMHLAYAVAQGRKFFGRRVVPAPVIYCGLEGETGMGKRVRALAAEHGDAPAFHYLAQALPLGEDASFADDLVQAIRETGARLAVIDTLARAMAGLDENSAADMSAMVRIFDRVRQETDAALLVVHHAGKDRSRGARGSNALRGAADLEIEVEAPERGERTWRCTKAKDDPGGDAFGFALRSVTLETDADGDPLATCLVEEGEAARGTARVQLSPQQRAALACLHETILASGSDLPAGHGFPPPSARGCRIDAWREECDRRGVANSDAPATRKRVFRRALAGLKDTRRVAEYDGWIWPLGQG